MKKGIKNPLVAKNVSLTSTFLWTWFLLTLVFILWTIKATVYDNLYKGRFEAGMSQGYFSAINELMLKATEGCNPLTVGDQTDPSKSVQLINVACLQQEEGAAAETVEAAPVAEKASE